MRRPARPASSPTALAVVTALGLTAWSASARAQLAPPPPMDPAQPSSPNAPASPGSDPTTEPPYDPDAALAEAEAEDSGRRFELFWLNADAGASYINMRSFSASDLALQNADSAGPMVGVSAGLRLVLFTIGPRFRYHALSSFNMWQLGGEIGLKIPISSVDILVGLHGGYAAVGRMDASSAVAANGGPDQSNVVSVRGFNAGMDFGVDYYVSSGFSVGLGVAPDFLYLRRPPVAIPADVPAEQRAQIENDPLYKRSGDAAGFGISGGIRLGGHLGL